MKNNKTLSALLVVASLWVTLTSGCNTIQGAGKDIEKAGDKIQDSAAKNK